MTPLMWDRLFALSGIESFFLASMHRDVTGRKGIGGIDEWERGTCKTLQPTSRDLSHVIHTTPLACTGGMSRHLKRTSLASLASMVFLREGTKDSRFSMQKFYKFR